LDADQALALRGSIDDVDDAARRGEICFGAARGVVRKRDSDFQIRANSHVKTRDERGAAAA
jgi:hypothetical protein